MWNRADFLLRLICSLTGYGWFDSRRNEILTVRLPTFDGIHRCPLYIPHEYLLQHRSNSPTVKYYLGETGLRRYLDVV